MILAPYAVFVLNDQPLVESMNTKVTAWPLVVNSRLAADEFILEPFLATITLLDPKVPRESIITISSPTLGDAGSVTVIGLDDVLASI
jgi:hypothetical protein